MKACGIVTEYNPFHNGHIYHIQEARKISQCDCMIAVMSGNFVQRGQPAIIDKWQRAQCCLQYGVDIVLELPYPFATQSADYFAQGAIDTLQLAGCECVVFGSESNDIDRLYRTLTEVEKRSSDKESSNALLISKTAEKVHSNDILGVSYLKALQHTNMIPYTIQRTNAYHDLDHHQKIASASAIRHAIKHNEDVSHTTIMADQLTTTHDFEAYYPYLQTLIMTSSSNHLKELFLVDEGMEQLFKKHISNHDTLASFVDACISKKYTRARIQRALVHILTQTSKAEINALPKLEHIRVLAFNECGRQYLSQLKHTSEVLIASRFSQIPSAYRELELRATMAYVYPIALPLRKEAIAKEWQSQIYRP